MPLSLRKSILAFLTETSGTFSKERIDLDEAARCWQAEVTSPDTLIWIRIFDSILTVSFQILGVPRGVKFLSFTPFSGPWKSWMNSLIGMSLR